MSDQPQDLGTRMRDDWNARARRDPLHWTVNSRPENEWDEQDYYQTGADTVSNSLDLFLKQLDVDPGDKKFLEIGCGAGRLTVQLAQRFASGVALDVSDEMARVTRAALKARSLKGVKVVTGNGIDLDGVKDETIDVVYSCIVFQHIPNPAVQASYLADCGRVLKPGGVFALEFYGDEAEYANLKPQWELRKQADNELGWGPLAKLELHRYETSICNPMPRDLLFATAQQAGLEIVFEVGAHTGVWWVVGRKA